MNLHPLSSLLFPMRSASFCGCFVMLLGVIWSDHEIRDFPEPSSNGNTTIISLESLMNDWRTVPLLLTQFSESIDPY